jgi:shikimate dehydrogenase
MRPIRATTRPYAVLGHPIAHSLSPVMHNASMERLGIDAVYLAFDVRPEALIDVLRAMRVMGFGGVNLTVPLKEAAFRGMDRLAESARLLGAVNTVCFGAEGMTGHNTDGSGFLRALEEAFGRGVEGDAVFLLGCGGAGRAVALTAAVHGARHLVLSDVNADRARNLASEIREAAPAVTVEIPADEAGRLDAVRRADLVVQASPVGMDPTDPPLLSSAAFRAGQRVFDLVYHHPETAIMREALAAGARAANGLAMLLHQGARAFEIWTGTPADTDAMREALQVAVYGK